MKRQLETILSETLSATPEIAGAEGVPADLAVVERTRDVSHGHFAWNAAMRLAKPLRKSPRDIASLLVEAIGDRAADLVESIDIAGPGFINFRLHDSAFHQEVDAILSSAETYGRSSIGAGEKVIVEYVSANPTGPLHVGHGRHAAYGATVANLLRATGHEVHTEYYVNDAGRQMDILALSVWLRNLQSRDLWQTFPGSAYQGGYVQEIAESASDWLSTLPVPDDLASDLPEDGDELLDTLIARAREAMGDDNFRAVLEKALENILGDIKNDLGEFGVHHDEWFSERSLETNGAIERALKRLNDNGKTYEEGGAIWFRATDYDDEKDRVVVRDNGRTTYFASDIAYHLQKRERGFDRLIDILGADHHGYVARVRGGLEAMGEPGDSLDVELVQFVALYRGGEKAQMSTRSGEFVTLRQLREEVGNDAARLFFVMRSNDQHLDFDLDLATSRSNENPVYYIQYAHARVCSVMRELAGRELTWDAAAAEPAKLTEPEEHALMLALTQYPEIIELAARQKAPQHLVHYLRDLANDLHSYYNAHRFLSDDSGLRNARLNLINATRQVLVNGLDLLGVSAPETM